MSGNQLGQATSPYLLLHKDNPVHWRAWGKEAFAEAEASGKPILLSIGYTTCHWCHVMNHESFDEPETAALMNELFINVKVDREERPDIDHLYQAASQTMGHSGGWPLIVFLTAEAKPFFIAGYLPKEPRFGQPPFQTVLRNVSQSFAERKDEIAQNTAAISQRLETVLNRDMRGPPENLSLDLIAMRIGQRFDIFFGGIVGQIKFPSVMLMEVLFRAFLRSGAAQFGQLVTVTIDNILGGGLYDHLGGGFARYTTDERWVVPHFEKMLYDNALLIEFLTGLWQFNSGKVAHTRVAETIAWLQREMKVGDAFASGLDADSEGEEGKFYTWSEAEVDAALVGTFSARFKTAYNVTRAGNFQGRNVLETLTNAHIPKTEADEQLFARQRALLLAVRDKRVQPMRDDKVLADWNGLAVSALANAGMAFQRPEWIAAAVRAFDFIVNQMSEGELLFHSWAAGQRGPGGFADDYANMARAALVLREVTGEACYLPLAQKWVATLNRHFWDEVKGGYFFASNDADPLIVRTRILIDAPTPAANGTMLTVLTRLWLATGDEDYARRAETLLRAFADEASKMYLSCGSYLNGYEYFASALQIVVVGPRNHPKTRELVRAVWERALPNRLLTVVAPDDDTLPAGHAASRKTMQNGQPTAYICQRGNCSAPITTPVALSQALLLPPRPAGTA